MRRLQGWTGVLIKQKRQPIRPGPPMIVLLSGSSISIKCLTRLQARCIPDMGTDTDRAPCIPLILRILRTFTWVRPLDKVGSNICHRRCSTSIRTPCSRLRLWSQPARLMGLAATTIRLRHRISLSRRAWHRRSRSSSSSSSSSRRSCRPAVRGAARMSRLDRRSTVQVWSLQRRMPDPPVPLLPPLKRPNTPRSPIRAHG
jgi:hypothetical protein